MEQLEYLFAAYSLIFILIGLYVIFVGRRQARLEREVGRLEVLLRAAEQAVPSSEQHQSGV